jgi:hypothetical protein
MNPNTRARVQARTSANYRLQALTIGAAVLGVAGTGAFSYAAAMTYTGKPAAVTTGDQQGPDDQGGSTNPTTNNGQTATGNTAPNARTPNTGNQAPTVTPRPKKVRHVQATTGGS